MTKRTKRVIDWTALAFVLWGLLSAVPLSAWGFASGPVVVNAGERPPVVIFHRHIWRDIHMRYSVVVREARTLRIVCEGSSGPFRYRAQPAGTALFALNDWAGGDDRCLSLPQGDYVMDTTWTYYPPLPFVLPRKATELSEFRVEDAE